MSIVINQKAINETYDRVLWAIFITRNGQRYAVRDHGFKCNTFVELEGCWVHTSNLSNFLVWNGEFQGHDDISSLIEE